MTTPNTQQSYVVAQGTSPINSVIPEARDPTSYDTDFLLYRLWLNTTTKALWILVGFTSFNGLLQAIWEPLSHGGAGDVAFLEGNSGGPVEPDADGIINTLGDGTTINVVGNPATNTLTWTGIGNARSIGVQATSGGGTNPVLPDGTGKIEIDGASVAAGTNPVRSVSTAANTLQIQVQRSQALAAPDSTKVGLANFSSLDFTVDANGYVHLSNASGPSEINLGISYNGGTGLFSITGQNGAALSVTNPAYVTISSKSVPGTFVTITITANQTFLDAAGASTIIGNTFATTNLLAYGSDMPFFIYAVLNDSENAISFMIARIPHATISPPATNIGKTGSALALTQGSFFALSNPTVADYDNNPCICIGAFRMRKNASNDWTVQTLSNGSGFNAITYIGADGIGQFHNESKFILPTGQFGASANSFFKPNGGTAPVFALGSANYYIQRNGQIFLACNMVDNALGAGAGAVQAQIAVPFKCQDGPYTTGNVYFVTAAIVENILGGFVDPSVANYVFRDAIYATGQLNLAAFGAGAGTSFSYSLNYRIQYS